MCPSCCSTPLVENTWACVLVFKLFEELSSIQFLTVCVLLISSLNKNRKMKKAKQVFWNKLEPWRGMIYRALSCFFVLFWGRGGIILSRTPLALDQVQMRRLLRRWTFSSFLLLPPGCRIDNCESCFSKDFCTKCKSGFYLHKGRCFDKCPEGFAPLEDTMECGGM